MSSWTLNPKPQWQTKSIMWTGTIICGRCGTCRDKIAAASYNAARRREGTRCPAVRKGSTYAQVAGRVVGGGGGVVLRLLCGSGFGFARAGYRGKSRRAQPKVPGRAQPAQGRAGPKERA